MDQVTEVFMKTVLRITAMIMTAVMLFAFASCGESGETALENTLGANANILTETKMLEEYKEDPSANASKIIGFGFTSEEFKKTFADNGTWKTYNLRVVFGNDNDYGVTVFGFDVGENGKNDVYISTEGDAVIGLPSKFTGTQEMYCRVIADSALSPTDIIKTLSKMDVQILYANAATGAEEITELQQGELMRCPIEFIF